MRCSSLVGYSYTRSASTAVLCWYDIGILLVLTKIPEYCQGSAIRYFALCWPLRIYLQTAANLVCGRCGKLPNIPTIDSLRQRGQQIGTRGNTWIDSSLSSHDNQVLRRLLRKKGESGCVVCMAFTYGSLPHTVSIL